MRPLLCALALLLALPATAQDRAGNNTPGEWVVTHHTPFGLWDSMCDERRTGDLLEQRCYLRYVDVFSPAPKFAAMFAFIVPADGGETLELGIERGTVFKPGGVRIEAAGTPVWTMAHRPCLFGGACTFDAAATAALLNTMSDADTLSFDFFDRHEVERRRDWDLSRFGDALADFRAETAARGL